MTPVTPGDGAPVARTYPDGFHEWPLEKRNIYFAKEAEIIAAKQKREAASEALLDELVRTRKVPNAGSKQQAVEKIAHLAPRVANPGAPVIKATPFKPRDPSLIPPRRWIYGRHYIRQFLTETVAPGAYGKSTLALTEALAIATGRGLLGVLPDEPTNVWYWNGEDPMEELERRLAATCLHYHLTPEDLEGRLFVDSGRDQEIVIAKMTRTGAEIAYPVVDQVTATIRANEIGLLIIDPFVASHRVTENDNPAIEMVAATWAKIADVTGCAVELVHHSRKTGGAEITVEDGRGGSALLAKARSARVLNGMSEDEAARAGVEKRRSFLRVDNGKANLSPAGDQADWYQLIGVEIGNGDNVVVVKAWKWPNPSDGVTQDDLQAVQAKIAAGRYRADIQSQDWAGNAVASVLNLDLSNKADKAKAAGLLKTWIAKGALRVVEANDARSMPRKFIEVGTPAGE
jgi:AAA domain